jgi:hypothetical protein
MFRRLFVSFVFAAGGIWLSGCSTDALSTAPAKPKDRIVSSIPKREISSTETTKRQRFDETVRRIVAYIKTDPQYRKIGLKTPEEKRWFKNLLYELWNRDITKREFIARGVKRYPSKRYEFTVIADAMQRV